MQKLIGKLPGVDLLLWLAPVGRATRLFFAIFSPQAYKHLSWNEFKYHARWMGHDSFHFVALSSVLISIALTIQCVVELQKYQAADISGMAISIGLMREMGPLTISIAWCARVSARISHEARLARARWATDKEFAHHFIIVRLLACLLTSVHLGTFGLVIGFITAALYSPLIGVNSSWDFAESARVALTDTDVTVYFVKLIAINPVVAVFAGSASGLIGASDSEMPVSAKAVTFTFLACYALNLAVTISAFLEGAPRI